MNLTPDQVLSALARLKLNQSSGARFLGISARHMRKIVAGEYQLSKAAGMLLRVMIRHKLTTADVEKLLPKEKGK